MFDFQLALITFLGIAVITLLAYIIYQWLYWIENGTLWDGKTYKQWVIEQRRRTIWSLAILAIILSIIMGFVSGSGGLVDTQPKSVQPTGKDK